MAFRFVVLVNIFKKMIENLIDEMILTIRLLIIHVHRNCKKIPCLSYCPHKGKGDELVYFSKPLKMESIEITNDKP